MGFSTDAIHAGQQPDSATNAVIVPLYQTSTYAHDSLGQTKGWGYARGDNPTREALERNIAALEGGRHGVAFASGMAAITAVVSLLKSGDHVVSTSVVYGGTYRLFATVMERFGLSFTYADSWDLKQLEAAIRPETRLVHIETPTNPLLSVTDIQGASQLAKSAGALLAVDNTFASPYFQRPLELGADVVTHSTTKYLNGHSDSVGGVAVTNDDDLQERIKHYQKTAGGTMSPFEAWLILRGTKTLAMRMRQHDANARQIAVWLKQHPKVQQVHWPGSEDHPQHQLAKRQMSGFGGMLAFELGSLERARTFLNAVRLCTLAESLGGVETLICHPASMTHGAFPAETRQAIGVTDGLVRLSVGCEDAEDLIADLEQALGKI